MASLDPKELIQRNIPLIVIYVIALLPLPLWFVLVEGGIKSGKKDSVEHALKKLRSKQSTIQKFEKRVNKKGAGGDIVFTPQYVEQYKSLSKELTGQIQKLEDLIRERDAELEKWFEDAQFSSLKPNQVPDHADYTQYWKSKAIPQLLETYKELVDSGAEDSDPFLYTTAPARDRMRRDQKRFWAQKYILEGIKRGAKHKIMLVETPVAARLLSAMQFVNTAVDARQKDKPKPLVGTFRATTEFLCSFRDVGTIVREILAQPIPMQILTLEVNKHGFRIEQGTLTVDGSEKVFLEDNFRVKLKDFSEFKGEKKLEEYIPEPAVRVLLEVEILDFDLPAKAKKAPTEGGEDDMGDEEGGG
jgi:hypothetical protein